MNGAWWLKVAMDIIWDITYKFTDEMREGMFGQGYNIIHLCLDPTLGALHRRHLRPHKVNKLLEFGLLRSRGSGSHQGREWPVHLRQRGLAPQPRLAVLNVCLKLGNIKLTYIYARMARYQSYIPELIFRHKLNHLVPHKNNSMRNSESLHVFCKLLARWESNHTMPNWSNPNNVTSPEILNRLRTHNLW